MDIKTAKAMVKSLGVPDETRMFNNGKTEIVHLEDITIGRVVLQPGWRWSKDLRPTVKTESCQAVHTQYVISGRLMVAMDDGSKFEIKADDTVLIPPGHDAWVMGDEPFIAIDFTGMKEYAKET